MREIPKRYDESDHELGTHFQRQDRLHQPLYVVTPVFNAVRFRSRWTHYQDFAKRVAEAGGVLITVEAAFGDRDFVVTEPGNPQHVQVRTRSELWLKECLINRGVARLSEIHPDWPKVAWVDADVSFERDDVMDATRHELEHYDIVQMWTDAIDMGPNNRPLPGIARSYAWCHIEGVEDPPRPTPGGDGSYYLAARGARGPGTYWHTGYAWACTRGWWDAVGGLIDWAVIGNGDNYMAQAMAGILRADDKHKSPSAAFSTMLLEWQARCQRGTLRGLGVVPGMLTHRWHGKKQDRQYRTRWQVLVDSGFDPIVHLKRDRQMIWALDEYAPTALRDGLRRIARARNEDSVDV